jgi:hypothetical protein
LVERLWLVKNNVDFDVAFSLPPLEVAAWAIIFGQFEGGVFDFSSMRWQKSK